MGDVEILIHDHVSHSTDPKTWRLGQLQQGGHATLALLLAVQKTEKDGPSFGRACLTFYYV